MRSAMACFHLRGYANFYDSPYLFFGDLVPVYNCLVFEYQSIFFRLGDDLFYLGSICAQHRSDLLRAQAAVIFEQPQYLV